MNCCCTENTKSVITGHNKKLLSKSINTEPQCNCRLKNKCPLNGKCITKNHWQLPREVLRRSACLPTYLSTYLFFW